MSGLKLKKKSLKKRQNTLLKDPSSILHILITAAKSYMTDLDSDQEYKIISNASKPIRFRRGTE